MRNFIPRELFEGFIEKDNDLQPIFKKVLYFNSNVM